jgi:prolyl oligopeptidase family protein
MGSRPMMLTHGTADTEDLPERTQAFFDQARADGLTIELHWCAGATHGRVDDDCADDFARWLDTFFGRTLSPPAA